MSQDFGTAERPREVVGKFTGGPGGGGSNSSVERNVGGGIGSVERNVGGGGDVNTEFGTAARPRLITTTISPEGKGHRTVSFPTHEVLRTGVVREVVEIGREPSGSSTLGGPGVRESGGPGTRPEPQPTARHAGGVNLRAVSPLADEIVLVVTKGAADALKRFFDANAPIPRFHMPAILRAVADAVVQEAGVAIEWSRIDVAIVIKREHLSAIVSAGHRGQPANDIRLGFISAIEQAFARDVAADSPGAVVGESLGDPGVRGIQTNQMTLALLESSAADAVEIERLRGENEQLRARNAELEEKTLQEDVSPGKEPSDAA